jgi:hypothetical protein
MLDVWGTFSGEAIRSPGQSAVCRDLSTLSPHPEKGSNVSRPRWRSRTSSAITDRHGALPMPATSASASSKLCQPSRAAARRLSAGMSSAVRWARTHELPTTRAAIGTAPSVRVGSQGSGWRSRGRDVFFTLPAPIADVAYQNKTVIYSILFKAAAETLITIAADSKHLAKHLGARIGAHCGAAQLGLGAHPSPTRSHHYAGRRDFDGWARVDLVPRRLLPTRPRGCCASFGACSSGS